MNPGNDDEWTVQDELGELRAQCEELERLARQLSRELDAARKAEDRYRAEVVRVTITNCDIRDERDHANTRWRRLMDRARKHPDALWLLDVDGIWAADEEHHDPGPAREPEGER